MTTFTITTQGGPDGQGRQRFTIEWPCEPTTFLHHGREITITHRAQEQHARVPETVARLQARGHRVVVDGSVA